MNWATSQFALFDENHVQKSSFEGSSATQPPQDFGQNDHQMSNVADSPAILYLQYFG